MKTAKVKFTGISPYSQGKHYQTEKLPKEIAKDYEIRTWRDRCHVNPEGYVFIPPMAFKNCIEDAARFLSIQIPGKGKSTYTKHFTAGILCMESVVLPVKKDDVQGEWLFVPSDGKRGGGSRVEKCFPVLHEWGGEVTFYILDETITEDVFQHHIEQAGSFIGLGRFRPRNGGFYGRFRVDSIEWE